MTKEVQDAVKNVAQSLRDVFIEEDIVHEQIAEIRAELHRLTDELERANGLLRRTRTTHYDAAERIRLDADIEAHLQGAGDEA